ncbi:hypothetical protein [Hydrotalea sp.]|uniref:hypothetical protein n=1 Tax=Hydrotalea sp. TaxID=2881279 RepID=UPI00260A1DDF|nr:hypothetical protein [Hydrotalea sp.]
MNRNLVESFQQIQMLVWECHLRSMGPLTIHIQAGMHLFTPVELCYFFSLNHRIRKERPIINFSGAYLDLEQRILSHPVLLYNQITDKAITGHSNIYLNIGYQRQYNRLLFLGYFGLQMVVCDDTATGSTVSSNGLQAGIGLGYVLGEQR